MESPITLYSFADFDRSGRVRWVLHELNLPFEDVRLSYDNGENRTENFLKISPFGKIPALTIGEQSIFESGAICEYLVETYGSRAALAPAPGSPLRSAYLQWCYFACTTLENAVYAYLRAARYQTETAEREAELKIEAEKVLTTLSQALGSQDYLVGNEFSLADVLTGYVMNVADRIGLLGNYPALKKYLGRLALREAAEKSKFFSTPWPTRPA
jgi:glutathione S-transferase